MVINSGPRRGTSFKMPVFSFSIGNIKIRFFSQFCVIFENFCINLRKKTSYTPVSKHFGQGCGNIKYIHLPKEM